MIAKMAPNQTVTTMENETDEKVQEDFTAPGNETYDEKGVKFYKLKTDPNYKHKVIIPLVIVFAVLHAAGLYGLYLILTFQLKLWTFLWGLLVGLASAEGIVLGAHRGFSHNAFKLNSFGQIMIIIFQTISSQNHLHWWVRDHRLHHKFVDTDADPYNAKRGFFFSHIGWMLMRKHPLVAEKGKTIDMSDIEANKFIMFQKRHYVPMAILFSIVIPTMVPVLAWNEDFWIAFFTCFAYRCVHILNATWCTNSIAHMYGMRSFDGRITATQSHFTDFISFGDGWHNYHHVFPWDHAFSEYGFKAGLSTKFLYFLKRIGVAYNLKTVSPELVYKHSMKYGDGSLTEAQLKYE